MKKYFKNNEGQECYIMECGCEGVMIPNIGWVTTPCDEHEEQEEYEEFAESTKFKAHKYF